MNESKTLVFSSSRKANVKNKNGEMWAKYIKQVLGIVSASCEVASH